MSTPTPIPSARPSSPLRAESALPADEELLRSALRGAEDAFTELVRRHGASIKAFALRLLKDPDAAEDVFAHTFIRVFQHQEEWQERGSARGFLFTIARNHCLDILRKQRRHEAHSEELLSLQRGLTFTPSPEAIAILRDDAMHLERALARIPESHREVLLLRLVHGMSGEETAQVLGISDEQVRSQLSYARKLLRSALNEPTSIRAVRPAWGHA